LSKHLGRIGDIDDSVPIDISELRGDRRLSTSEEVGEKQLTVGTPDDAIAIEIPEFRLGRR